MSTCTFFANKQEVVTRRIAGETVIVPVKGGVENSNFIYTLNQPGTMIWELLCEGASDFEIRSALCKEYDVTEEEAGRDIEDFLSSMQSEGLIYSSRESGG